MVERNWQEFRARERKATERKWQKEIKPLLIRAIEIDCLGIPCNLDPRAEYKKDIGASKRSDGTLIISVSCKIHGLLGEKELPRDFPPEQIDFINYYFFGENPPLLE